MYGTYAFLSEAQLYSYILGVTAVIVLGYDNLYWVVDKKALPSLQRAGCSLVKNLLHDGMVFHERSFKQIQDVR